MMKSPKGEAANNEATISENRTHETENRGQRRWRMVEICLQLIFSEETAIQAPE